MDLLFNDQRKAIVSTYIIYGDGTPMVEVTDAVTSLKVIQKVEFTKPVYSIDLILEKDVLDNMIKVEEFWLQLKINENLDKERNAELLHIISRDILIKIVDYPKLKIPEGKLVELTLVGFEDEHLQVNEDITTTNLRLSTVHNALFFHLKKNIDKLALKKVVINKIENEKIYNEIQIKNSTFLDTIVKLDKNYGLYKEGSATVYVEDKILYILNKNVKQIYPEDPMHYSDLKIFVRDKESLADIPDYKGAPTQSKGKDFFHFWGHYVLNVKSEDLALLDGAKTNFHTENFDALVGTSFDEGITAKGIANSKISKTNVIANFNNPHDPFSNDKQMKDRRVGIIKLELYIKNSSFLHHKMNTQYHVEFQKESEIKFDGVYTSDERTIEVNFNEDRNIDVQCHLKLKNIELTTENSVFEMFGIGLGTAIAGFFAAFGSLF